MKMIGEAFDFFMIVTICFLLFCMAVTINSDLKKELKKNKITDCKNKGIEK